MKRNLDIWSRWLHPVTTEHGGKEWQLLQVAQISSLTMLNHSRYRQSSSQLSAAWTSLQGMTILFTINFFQTGRSSQWNLKHQRTTKAKLLL